MGDRIRHFDYFRGVAIVLIVAGHSYYPWGIDTFAERVVANLITGSTALFVFISGFFFHRVYAPKFNLRAFLAKKARLVLLPYVLLSSLWLLQTLIRHGSPATATGHPVISKLLHYLLFLWQGTAEALTGYWYIPFIMLIFAASPLFLQYIQLSLKIQLTIFALLMVVSMLVQRPLNNLSPIHSVIYFTPIYLLGITYSMHQNAIADAIKPKSLHLGLSTVALSALQVLVTGSYGNYHKSAIFSYAGFDLNILQKLLCIFFLLSILARLERRSIPLLGYLASISFAIYFLHSWVLIALQRLSMERYLAFAPGPLIFLIKTALILGVSIWLAETLKTRFRQRSRYLIGY